MQPYDMTAIYRPGHDNPADYLSCHPSHPYQQMAWCWGWYKQSKFHTLRANCAELSLAHKDSIILKGHRIVLPEALQNRAAKTSRTATPVRSVPINRQESHCKCPHYQQPRGQKSVLTLDTSKMESTLLILTLCCCQHPVLNLNNISHTPPRQDIRRI